MANQKRRRNEWKLVSGKWTRSLGTRGTRIRLFQMTKDGKFYRDAWVPGKGKDRRCIGTADRAEADRIGRRLLSELLRDANIGSQCPLRLGDLWLRYQAEAPQFLDNHRVSKANDANHAAVLIGFFGEDCDVRDLTENDLRAFATTRKAGGVSLQSRRITRPVGTRSVEVEVKLLRGMMKWATTVRVGKGQRLLERSPLEGVRGFREANPKRPFATWDRFTKTRETIREMQNGPRCSPCQRRRWLMLEFALVLAEATGRRLGSIRQLRWDDLNASVGSIRWRAESDKQGHEKIVQAPPALLDELRFFHREMGGAFGGFVFPSEKDRNVAVRRDVFDKWLRYAETKADLAPLAGGLWHPYRRSWAMARKHLPVADVAAAGGWRDYSTLLRCYTQPDDETMLAVMAEPRKLRDMVKTA